MTFVMDVFVVFSLATKSVATDGKNRSHILFDWEIEARIAPTATAWGDVRTITDHYSFFSTIGAIILCI